MSQDWLPRRALVVGLARSGRAAVSALERRGVEVVAVDRTLGNDGPEAVDDVDLLVKSPGVPGEAPVVAAARERGVPVWSEVELGYRLLGGAPFYGVTGTNGKTTTTEMTVAALRAAGRDAIAAGNVGTPLVTFAPGAEIVAELSSFQLQGIEDFRVPVAVLLNIAHDHLDWHGSDEAYRNAKARVFENQREADVAIVHDDPACRSIANGAATQILFADDELPSGGAGIQDGWIVVPQGRVVETSRLRARGRPNRSDAIAAAAAACALGADPKTVGEALAAFEPRPHRIEQIAVIDGVTYINDSKATDPHATLAALEGMTGVVLIAGGRNKGIDLSELAVGAAHLRAVVAIGETAAEIDAAFGPTGVPVEKAGSIEEAVARARELATAGDTVLLSPACASFDMFRNYEERGDAFRAAVRRIDGSDL
jgi:UDP-N-acetylmuramoylalanine--D-glutamate ligase